MPSNSSTTYPKLSSDKALSATTMGGGGTLLFCIPFILAGGFVTGIGTGLIQTNSQNIHAPLWVITMVGVVFAAAGVWILFAGVRDIRTRKNIAAGRAADPHHPWMWDYGWFTKGSIHNQRKQAKQYTIALAFFALFLAPFNWMAVSTGSALVWFIIGIFDIALVAGLKATVEKWRYYSKYGDTYALYDQFPCFLGDRVTLTLQGLPTELYNPVFTLRCIQEGYETASRKSNRQEVVCYERFVDQQEPKQSGALNLNNSQIVWQLPDDADLTSTPCDRPAQFWELEIETEKYRGNKQFRFILPVYTQPPGEYL